MRVLVVCLATAGGLAACTAAPGSAEPEPEVTVQAASALAASRVSLAFAAAEGAVTFQVTLPAGQQYVELFSRRNGIQNLAEAIAARGEPGPDGTTRYTFTARGYAVGDVVEYRFYSYLPGAGGVFTPGPAEAVWAKTSLAPSALTIPVGKDASLIGASYAVGNGWDMRFGGYPTVDVASYHHESLALFGFPLASTPAGATVTRARLVLRQVRSAAGSPGTVTLGVVSPEASWSEATVTRRQAPAFVVASEQAMPTSGPAALDVTAAVAEAVKAGRPEIGFVLVPGIGNFFIDSKENASGLSAVLEIETSSPGL